MNIELNYVRGEYVDYCCDEYLLQSLCEVDAVNLWKAWTENAAEGDYSKINLVVLSLRAPYRYKSLVGEK